DRGLLAPRRFARGDTCAAASLTTEHLHLVRDDSGRVTVLPVGLVLILARPELAFDVDLRALAQVLGRDLGELAEHRDGVPFGAFLVLSRGLVLPLLAGRDAQVRDRAAARHVARL